MQVYKRVPIITNKHPIAEREGVPHHVMDHVNWDEEYFIHRYSDEANAAIERIHAENKTPIIIGGTHYYLQNLLFKNKTVGEMEQTYGKRDVTTEELQILDGPVEQLFSTLEKVDPLISHKFHPKDQRKLRRALEIYYTTGQKPSDMYQEQKLEELEDTSLKFNTLFYWIYCDPDTLRDRLDKRVDAMMTSGALDEIKEMNAVYQASEPKPDITTGIWQVIGFKEFLPWLENGQSDQKLFDEGVDRMKIRTRQYAKYQVKWIKKLLGVELFKESRFNYKYGGKLYLLDATDLSKWKENVSDRGLAIAEEFINKGPLGVSQEQAPENLTSLLPLTDFFETFNSNKTLQASNNWKHYECSVCVDAKGEPLVAVGEQSWEIHQNSRRHKKKLQSKEKRKRTEEFLRQYKKAKDTEQTDT
ncbi:hypothetical protein PUMCH_000472 [Australozyma saopauloensis]|uniref:tRNA dimethylallyltransferase n=1 Tax=Australozyma saopauloensis TaxID=291208 RepID=A0AAX4H478_9ASCO|nr:hypothetical protein PUMCH_000472 [[Candida] saopauloensis]